MYTPEYLEDFSIKVFEKMGCSPADAKAATKVFIAAEPSKMSVYAGEGFDISYNFYRQNYINRGPVAHLKNPSLNNPLNDIAFYPRPLIAGHIFELFLFQKE